MTRPAIEFLEQLPEPYRSEALAEASKQQLETRNIECRLLGTAIVVAFIGSQTPQGADYWRDVAYKFHTVCPSPESRDKLLAEFGIKD